MGYIAYLVDEDFKTVFQVADFLSLDMSRSENAVGAIVMKVPTRYEIYLRNVGILESIQAAVSMPRFFILIFECSPTTCCLWEEAVWLIDRPARVLENDGETFIQLEAVDQIGFLEYRSVYADEDNPITAKSLPADSFMHEVFRDHFGDVQGIDPRRDWISNGTVADGVDPACGFDPYEARLEFKGTLLNIFQDAAKASTANMLPIYFDLVPTLIATPLGERASLPLVFNTYCDHRGADRTVTNTDGNIPVQLSVQNGSILSFTLGPDFRSDHSVAMAVGSGQGTTRPRALRTNDTRINSSPRFGWKESLSIDREAEDQANTDSAADELLESGKSRGQFIVTITDSPAARYGMPACGGAYHWGDCVTLCDQTVAINVRVTAVNISVDRGKVQRRIKLEVTDEQP